MAANGGAMSSLILIADEDRESADALDVVLRLSLIHI